MDYSVTISPEAKQDLRRILDYCVHTLQNTQAARNIYEDATNTILRLSRLAGSLKPREDLPTGTFRTIRFKKHKYLMVYKINGTEARVYRIYHTSQDIKSKLRRLSQ